MDAIEKIIAERELRWVSCAQDLSWDAARYRHLARRDSLDTVCGHSASLPGIWRGNTTKPECPTCVEAVSR